MLSMTEIQRALARIHYKPGWSFRAYDGVWEGQHLAITTEVPDAYHPGQTTTLDVHTMLPPIPDTPYLYRWLAWRVGRVEIHEMREFLRVDGKPLFDPHAPCADRDLV